MKPIRVSIEQKWDTGERKFVWLLRTSAGYPLDGIILSVKGYRDAENALRDYSRRRQQMGLGRLAHSCLKTIAWDNLTPEQKRLEEPGAGREIRK